MRAFRVQPFQRTYRALFLSLYLFIFFVSFPQPVAERGRKRQRIFTRPLLRLRFILSPSLSCLFASLLRFPLFAFLSLANTAPSANIVETQATLLLLPDAIFPAPSSQLPTALLSRLLPRTTESERRLICLCLLFRILPPFISPLLSGESLHENETYRRTRETRGEIYHFRKAPLKEGG